jgi:glutamate racemase
VFDSGLGGLTVVRRIRECLPAESIVYVADQAHVPYGGRELNEVRDFACAISEALLASGCRAVVMACNISSAVALPVEQVWHPDRPLLGVILPGAEAAVAHTRNGRVGVLATEGTVKSGAYTRALRSLDPRLVVMEVACPAFVPLVEAGREASLEAEAAARDYLAPLTAIGCDTVVLGCTHYPFLLPVLQRLSPKLQFLDPAEQTALRLARTLECLEPATTRSTSVSHRLFTTGDLASFRSQLQRFVPAEDREIETAQATWIDGVLQLG